MIRGGSRGGIVALLAGERDQRFKRVAPVAFNVDFIGLTANQYNDRTYKEQFLTGLINVYNDNCGDTSVNDCFFAIIFLSTSTEGPAASVPKMIKLLLPRRDSFFLIA